MKWVIYIRCTPHQRLGRKCGMLIGQHCHCLLWDNVPVFVLPTDHGSKHQIYQQTPLLGIFFPILDADVMTILWNIGAYTHWFQIEYQLRHKEFILQGMMVRHNHWFDNRWILSFGRHKEWTPLICSSGIFRMINPVFDCVPMLELILCWRLFSFS